MQLSRTFKGIAISLCLLPSIYTMESGWEKPIDSDAIKQCALTSHWFVNEYLQGGLKYYIGNDVATDYNKAFKFFEFVTKLTEDKAAHAAANLYMGHIYRTIAASTIQSHNQDLYFKAIEYYQQASHQQANKAAQAEAFIALGIMLRLGEGIPVDYDQALEFFTKAALQKESKIAQIVAYNNLGLMYYDGQGRGINYKLSARYFKLATQGENMEERLKAHLMLGVIYYYSTDPEIPINYEQATKHFQYIVLQENSVEKTPEIASLMLGQMHALGQACELNYEKAIYYLQKAEKITASPSIKKQAEALLAQITKAQKEQSS